MSLRLAVRASSRLEGLFHGPFVQVRCIHRSTPKAARQSTVSAAHLKFGQPVHETHPHLLKPGELTPGITALEYATRRARLAAKLPTNAIAVVAASEVKYRSGVVFYPFRQDPDFFYLTGFNEPEAIAVIESHGSGGEHIFHLFVRPKDSSMELWEGARSGIQAAQDVFNADEAGDVADLPNAFREILARNRKVYIDLDSHRTTFTTSLARKLGEQRSGMGGVMSHLLDAKVDVKPLRPLMNDLRVLKSESEVANMRLAGKASGRAITKAMSKRFSTEKSLESFLEYEFREGGCDSSAYVPVVAGGQNALSIHYVRNDDLLRDNDMVLVDAGGEYGGYVTDITRTWPVNGKFSAAQRDLYEAVLRVQRTCVSLCREDASVTLDKLHEIAENGLADQLKQMGIPIKKREMPLIFPHHLGHYIGIELHDTPGSSRQTPLRTGHCVTIEPGLYFPNDDRWPAYVRGMGVRIEDSVSVQEETPLVLTTEAVKEVADIEAMAEAHSEGSSPANRR